MDYEKKYKNALERARNLHKDAIDMGENIRAKQCEIIFPELVESDDERIRKTLIEMFSSVGKKDWRDIPTEKIIAWLEKQGGNQPTIVWHSINEEPEEMRELLCEWESNDATWHEIAFYHADTKSFWDGKRQVEEVTRWCYIDDLLEKQGVQKTVDEIAKEVCKDKASAVAFLKSAGIMNEKGELAEPYRQDKQRHTDKVEPKFKVGDWVVCEVTGSVYQIKNRIENLSNYKYGYDLTNGGYIGSDEVNHYHIWTIEDALDGDVLQLGEVTAIFKEYIGNGNCKCYCSVCNGEFEIPSQDGADNSYGCHNATPATKEQRDTLIKAMTDAGYTFDYEKKELKKIHVIDEGKAEMDYCFTKMMNGEKAKPQSSTPMSYGKELEARMYEACDRFNAPNTDPNRYSAADLFYAGVKAERDLNTHSWSEDDEKMLVDCFNILHRSDYPTDKVTKTVNWLKSLKDRYTWKPSDEQMNLLSDLVEDNNQRYFYTTLNSLYEQLKKLKGE